MKNKNEWIEYKFKSIKSNIDKDKLLRMWKKISYERVNCDFVCLPYINLMSNKISYIPIKMLTKMYMSNGMCAGNTKEEAIVQGLSEVFERVCNKEVILEKLTPPTVPISYIKNFPRVYNMIKSIKECGKYNIIVKDCSLNKKYPVLAVIYINKESQTYFVKFGSHPIFEIALERCLTELLQGQNIYNMKGVKEFSYKQSIKDEEQNLLGILVNGSGYYPSELFLQEHSYKFKPWEDLSKYNNKELLTYMLDLIYDNGYEVYVRDVSYLGFPSYSVIVPNFSEIDEIDDLKSLESYIDFVSIKRRIRKLKNIADCEIEKLIYLLEKWKMNGPISAMKLIGLNTNSGFSWHYNDMNLFIFTLYYKLRDYKNAHKYFNEYLDTFMVSINNVGMYKYYKCVRDYIGCKIDNLSEETIINRLKLFYSIDMIKQVISEFKCDDLYDKFGIMNCFDCRNCKFKTNCNHLNIENVYKILKYQYKLNPPSQNNLKYTYHN